MPLAECPKCSRVLDVPDIPRSWRTPEGICAKCAEVPPEKLMELPVHVVHAFKKPAPRSAITIERCAPPKELKKGRVPLPFGELTPPDADGNVASFLVPYNGVEPRKAAQRVANSLHHWRKTNGNKWTVVTQRSDAEGGTRVYRLK